jgi:hypothetical protein
MIEMRVHTVFEAIRVSRKSLELTIFPIVPVLNDFIVSTTLKLVKMEFYYD